MDQVVSRRLTALQPLAQLIPRIPREPPCSTAFQDPAAPGVSQGVHLNPAMIGGLPLGEQFAVVSFRKTLEDLRGHEFCQVIEFTWGET